MPFRATVLPVMLASPADVHEYRAIARDVLHEWNYIHCEGSQLILMPVGWETHSSPELGASAQELINDRVLKECDLLIVIFWTRLGTRTDHSLSGTVEEIQRHVKAGKPAMVYFSQQPVAPESLDPAQYEALKKFREWCAQNGLIETFLGAEDFRSRLRRHIQIAMQKNEYIARIIPARNTETENSNGPVQPPDQEISVLSAEAKTLLLEASKDPGGNILSTNVAVGRIIQAGSTSLGDPADRRVMAKWEYGLEQLLNMHLVRQESSTVFTLTDAGYRVADRLTAVSSPSG